MAPSQMHPTIFTSNEEELQADLARQPRAVWWASVLRHKPAVLHERRREIGEVIVVTWIATAVLIAYPLVAFGWGTRWTIEPIYWLILVVSPASKVVLNHWIYAMPWAQAEAHWFVKLLAVTQVLSGVVPIVWALTETGDAFPFSRLGSRAYFTATLPVVITAVNLAGLWSNPGLKKLWDAPLKSVMAYMCFHGLRVADPLADGSLVLNGLRSALSGSCPFLGNKQNCAAHILIMSLMTLLLAVDFVAAILLAGVVHTLGLGPEAEGRLSLHLELTSVVCEAAFTALGAVFVSLRMTSKDGLDLLFVCVCAANTALLVLWTLLMLRRRHSSVQADGMATLGTDRITTQFAATQF